MQITGMDHITINIKDLQKTLYFYGELLGLKQLPSVEMSDSRLYYFQIPGGGRLELIEYFYETRTVDVESTDKGVARHFAFASDDVFALEKKLTEAGYPFHTPVNHVPQLGFAGGLTKDPNGFELEFLQYI